MSHGVTTGVVVAGGALVALMVIRYASVREAELTRASDHQRQVDAQRAQRALYGYGIEAGQAAVVAGRTAAALAPAALVLLPMLL